MEMRFYRCAICGKIIAVVKATNAPLICCGQPMKELIPNTSDGAFDKHVPVYEVNDHIVKINIGSIPHPMTPEHHIEWVAIKTKFGNQRKSLAINSNPEVTFVLDNDDEVINVYAYCNLHSLFSAK